MRNDIGSLPRRALTLAGAIMAGTGLIMTIVGIALGWWTVLPDASRMRTEATITALGAQTTTVTYDAGGQTYDARLYEHFSGDTIGKRIEVAYKVDAPASVRSVRGGIALLGAMGGSGVGMIALGAAFVLGARIRERRRVTLIANGTPIQARIVGVDQNRMTRVNGRYPWVIRCEGVVPGSPDTLRFTSEMWLEDPTPYLRAAGLTTLPVYVDPAKPGKIYAVDDSAVRPS